MSSKKARQSISPKLRFEVFKRDGFTCLYCGAHPPAAILHADHIDPVANGGDNSIDNLTTACNVCNGGKGARLLSSVPASLADKAAEVAEREKQLRGYNQAMKERKQRLEDDVWEVADVYLDHFCGQNRSISKADFQSIKTFLEKLPLYEVVDAMEKAVAKVQWNRSESFRYFCGVCWNKIKESAL